MASGVELPELKKLAAGKDTFVTTLALMAISSFGLECLEWDPVVVNDEFADRFDIAELSSLTCDKLQTGLMLIGTDAYTSTLEGFLAGTHVMDGNRINSTEVPFCDIDACAWGIQEYLQLMEDTADMGSVIWSPDIIKYIQEVAKIHGIYKFPSWMRFADIGSTSIPDAYGDIQIFEMFNQRQASEIAKLELYVMEQQKKLAAQLDILKKAKLLAKPA